MVWGVPLFGWAGRRKPVVKRDAKQSVRGPFIAYCTPSLFLSQSKPQAPGLQWKRFSLPPPVCFFVGSGPDGPRNPRPPWGRNMGLIPAGQKKAGRFFVSRKTVVFGANESRGKKKTLDVNPGDPSLRAGYPLFIMFGFSESTFFPWGKLSPP